MRAAIVDAFFPLVRPDDFLSLPSLATHATLATPMSTGAHEETRQTRVSRARLRKDNRRHPFVAACVQDGVTVTEIAAERKRARSTVQSWYDADTDNARPIPRADAEWIKARFGKDADGNWRVPLTCWARLGD
jgi:hypothetical protein